VIGAQFDTYLEPLMEDLKLLWEVGVHVRDVATFNGQTQFNMCVILMWTMHDLPAYGTIARCEGIEGAHVVGQIPQHEYHKCCTRMYIVHSIENGY
jgi:hypothetical protein